ncbi:hypothetical protein Pst134EB_031070 [Puccinia striiformis f. sp. tritici]|uniref:RNA helicase n=1 Tax=Puccinia striiformis f. sp. tritici PST-78 TaxID=1165861 RepID=A0A0L0VZK0_9BASI|nr:hypothetical protein Pst134EB_031070 [Puccinia striiformis f. sp. tritici]KNF04627.1 hypothetical protein PSTG_02115 [Puccinia striiformis f. sp. tritici PST-78]
MTHHTINIQFQINMPSSQKGKLKVQKGEDAGKNDTDAKIATSSETQTKSTDKKKNKRKKDDNEDQTAVLKDENPQLEKNDKKKKRKKQDQVPVEASVPQTTSTPTDVDMVDGTVESKDIDDNTAEQKKKAKKDKKKKKKDDDTVIEQSSSIKDNDLPASVALNGDTSSKPDTTNSTQDTTTPDPSTATPTEEVVKKSKKSKKEKKDKKSSDPIAPATATTSSNPVSQSIDPAEIEEFISSNKLTYEPPEIVTQLPPVLKFDNVVVHDSLRKAFAAFQKPSPIQSAVWPVLLAGRDVVGIAETGSGKTLAFGVPALQHILDGDKNSKAINVLVIAPTRELAMQTETTLSDLGKLVSPPIRSLCVYGGVDKNIQRKALANSAVRVVAGTPGRLLDLANEGHLKLDQVSWLILDEADRMLDKGFENDIRAIINLCKPSGSGASKSRLTTMFSATWPTSVRRLAADFMNEPVRILVGADELTASCSVEQTVEVLEETRGKEWKLLNTLKDLGINGHKNTSKDKIIVFALYKKEAQRIHEFLLRKGFQACCIEGNMSQDKRSKSLEDFMSGKSTILVATDVAARGLDIPKVEYVINVTFPLTIEDYIHRIGRTGRAGRTGKSITYFTDEDKSHAGELMRVLKDAGQVVPEALKQWGGQIKKKTHAAYGDHWKEVDTTIKAKKITFD